MLHPLIQSSGLPEFEDPKEISQRIISIKTPTSKPYYSTIHPGLLLVTNALMHQTFCLSDTEQYKSQREKWSAG